VEVIKYAIDIISTKNIIPDLIAQFYLKSSIEHLLKFLIVLVSCGCFCMFIFSSFIICPS